MKKVILVCLLLLLTGCVTRLDESEMYGIEATFMTSLSAPFFIPMPAAAGTTVEANEQAIIDYSNASDGYIMVKYLKPQELPVIIAVQAPGTTEQYTYFFKTDGEYEILPLSEGSGQYTINMTVPAPGGRYAVVAAVTFDAAISDQFAPFLRPNRLVNYTLESKVVKKAEELLVGQTGLIERIKSIYEFVITHFEYDYDLASNVPMYYVPDLDYVYDAAKGICYDYASTMVAMLRSQGIISKLVFGYTSTGEYHAWIDVYSDVDGWLTGIMFFDGTGWSLMDPTFASMGGEKGEQFAMHTENYEVKTVY